MFTGIITHLGTVKEKSSNTLVISTDPSLLSKVTLGMSIAVNGICLTTVAFDENSFSIEFMPETESKTTIQQLTVGSLVNLEMPATSETFLAGHIVQGHVDAIGTIQSIKEEGNSRIISLQTPQIINKYIVEKGSITLNGISLTVISVNDEALTVGIIPHTWENTMLSTVSIGDTLNIEVDILAKYIEKLIKK